MGSICTPCIISYRNRRLIIKVTLVCGCFAVFLWNLRSSPPKHGSKTLALDDVLE